MSGHYLHADAIWDVKTALKGAGKQSEIKENWLTWQKNKKKSYLFSKKKFVCLFLPLEFQQQFGGFFILYV